MTDRVKLEAKFGDPTIDPKQFELKHITIWDCSAEFPFLTEILVFGNPKTPLKRMRVNRLLVPHLRAVFSELFRTGLYKELKTYDGGFEVRFIRGYEKQGIPSIHSWGLAIDFNARENGLGMPVKFSKEFLDVFRRLGWTCGADFKRLDGMHFQFTNV